MSSSKTCQKVIHHPVLVSGGSLLQCWPAGQGRQGVQQCQVWSCSCHWDITPERRVRAGLQGGPQRDTWLCAQRAQLLTSGVCSACVAEAYTCQLAI